jgi:probable HAF family extracellular repeat protein
MTTSRPRRAVRRRLGSFAGAAVAGAALLASLGHTADAASPTTYTVAQVSANADAFDINAAGHVAANILDSNGLSLGGGLIHDGQTTLFGDLVPGNDDTVMFVRAVNGQDQAVGSAFNLAAHSVSRGVTVTNGTVREATPGMFVNAIDSKATGIDGQGLVVGFSKGDPTGPSVAWTVQGGKVTTLPPLAGPNAAADGVNDAGQIVGASNNANGRLIATMWTNNRAKNLGVLARGKYSEALAVNAGGHAVGVSAVDGGDQVTGRRHAVLFHDGVVTDLTPTLPAGINSAAAVDINAADQVVGFDGANAVLWQDGATTAIKDLVPATATINPASIGAVGINDRGQIVIDGRLNGESAAHHRVFVLTPQA